MSTDVLELITYLLPGFLAAWVFYGLTSHPKPTQFERIVQALIFTFIIQVLVFPVAALLFCIGQTISLSAWDARTENATALVLALLLGSALAYFTNNDLFHSRLRKLGFTTRTSHPSEWFYIFSDKVTFVVLELFDGRRLYGWPKEWPIEHGQGQFYIMEASWLLENGDQLHLTQLDGILIPASEVRWVEFIEMESDENEQSQDSQGV